MKILIIKLGAKGDVVRTLSILESIKDKYKDSEIYWVTKKDSIELFNNNPYITKVFSIPFETKESYDILYNFDIEDDATKLAKEIKADKKFGFYSENDYPAPFNFASEYYINTIFDDEIKKNNKKTYQEMMFEVAELPYKKELGLIYLNDEETEYGERFLRENNIDKNRLIGMHIGSAPRWPSKTWHEDNIIEFIKKSKSKRFEILLFAGPNDKQRLDKIIDRLNKEDIIVFKNNPNNTDRQFFSLINICSKIISSDSFALHVGVALKKQVIGLFFCSAVHEVETYNILKKIVAESLYDFFPEKMDKYEEKLTKSISADDVLEIIEDFDLVKVANSIIKDKEKFLVIKRKENEIHANKWAFPGGVIENGETVFEALKREIHEEVGLELTKIIKKISEYYYEREDNIKTKGTCFLVKTKSLKEKISPDIEDAKWVTIEEFIELDHIKGLDEELLSII
jgi:mutator protein MutT